LFRQYAVEADFHPFVKGVNFDHVWRDRVRAKFGDIFVYFASLNDLIKMRQAIWQAEGYGGPEVFERDKEDKV